MKKNNFKYFILYTFLLLLISCKDTGSKMDQSIENGVEQKQEEIITIDKDENKNREKWQKPETVVRLMGDLTGKTVADIGAGTGYFTFRIAMKADKVIAIDIEKDYLDVLDNLKEKLPLDIQTKIETRLAKEDDPLLKQQEVDLIVIINTFSFIDNKLKYLEKLKNDLKPGGKIFIVDFKMKNLPIDAPDKKDRLPVNKLENLLEKSGFHNIQTDDTTLDFQYIIIAEK
ncbi:MAG TPA: class I SAM-dependent methyltransferase [Bacteroidetes bacterium]|nr:class I SAM-dependent methyltransferase [Bacteroidota bacterium]